MPPPAYLQAASSKKGHHMGDYIPPEELEKFMSACNDAAAQKAMKEAAERAKIQADNVGHTLLESVYEASYVVSVYTGKRVNDNE
ncbi:unnamed protein product [Rhodiola kirilowii]